MLQNASSSVLILWQSRRFHKVAVFKRREFCPAKRHQLCADFWAEPEAPKSCSFQSARVLCCKTPSALWRFFGRVGGSKKLQFSIGASFVLQNDISSVVILWQTRRYHKVAVINRREFCPAKRHQLCADFLAESEAPKSVSFQSA